MKKAEKQKLPKGVDEVYVDSLNGRTIDELKAEIVRLQVQNEENEAFKESEQFQQAKSKFDYEKEQFDLIAKPIKETTTILKNKTKLVLQRLKDKGAI